jgi:hypothetical protein
MRARRMWFWLAIFSALMLAVAFQPVQSRSVPLPAATGAMYQVTPFPTRAPVPTPVSRTASGVRLAASVGPTCAVATQYGTQCVQPYAGEFVVTALNGAVVTRVMTDYRGPRRSICPLGSIFLGRGRRTLPTLAQSKSMSSLIATSPFHSAWIQDCVGSHRVCRH